MLYFPYDRKQTRMLSRKPRIARGKVVRMWNVGFNPYRKGKHKRRPKALLQIKFGSWLEPRKGVLTTLEHNLRYVL